MFKCWLATPLQFSRRRCPAACGNRGNQLSIVIDAEIWRPRRLPDLSKAVFRAPAFLAGS